MISDDWMDHFSRRMCGRRGQSYDRPKDGGPVCGCRKLNDPLGGDDDDE